VLHILDYVRSIQFQPANEALRRRGISNVSARLVKPFELLMFEDKQKYDALLSAHN